MALDPAQEWLRLQRLYLEMGDIELEKLYDEFNELTPVAQSVLEPILRERGLWQAAATQGTFDLPKDDSEAAEELDSESELREHGVAARSFETFENAELCAEFLRDSGIPCLTIRTKRGVPVRFPDLLVSPDDLDRAAALLDGADIEQLRRQYEDSETGPELKTSDKCPQCSSDQILLQAERPDCLNAWACAQCGHLWVDPFPDDWPARTP